MQLKFLDQTLRFVHLPWERGKKKDTGNVFAKAQSSSELSKQKKGRTGPSIFPPHHRKMPLRTPAWQRSFSSAHVLFNYFLISRQTKFRSSSIFSLKKIFPTFISCILIAPCGCQLSPAGTVGALGLWDTG